MVKKGKITTENFSKLCFILELDVNEVLFGEQHESCKNLNSSKGVRFAQKERIKKMLKVKESNDHVLKLLNLLLVKNKNLILLAQAMLWVSV